MKKYFLSIVLIALFVNCFSNKTSELNGIWRGTVDQFNYGSYPTVMTLFDVTKGKKCGSIYYPSLRCGGILTCFDIQGEKYIIKEKIEYGYCIDNGIIHLTKNEDGSLNWTWFYQNGKKGAKGVIYREKN